MQIDNLIIEITRKCNFSCDHCLRGKAENKDIPFEVIDALFSSENELNSIGSICLTGGEPSLNVKAIDYILLKCKENRVYVDSFYIVTNGGETSCGIDFMNSLMDLYLYCGDKDASRLDISDSYFHEFQQDVDSIEKLKLLRFVSNKSRTNENNLLNEGMAKENQLGRRENTPDTNFLIDDFSDIRIDDESFYVNVNGDVCLECDLSYESQEKYKIGNVLDMPIHKMAKNSVTK